MSKIPLHLIRSRSMSLELSLKYANLNLEPSAGTPYQDVDRGNYTRSQGSHGEAKTP